MYGPDTLSMATIQETLQVQFQLHSYVNDLNAKLLEVRIPSASSEFQTRTIVVDIHRFIAFSTCPRTARIAPPT